MRETASIMLAYSEALASAARGSTALFVCFCSARASSGRTSRPAGHQWTDQRRPVQRAGIHICAPTASCSTARSSLKMGGRFSRKQAADGAPAGNGVVIEAGLAEALASQRNRRDAAQRAADAVGNPDAAADATVRKLAADFENERRAFQESRAAELSSLEADRLDDVKRQVALLHSKYDFVRKEAAPRCVAEETAVLDCYSSKNGAGVLECAAAVDAYAACARGVADDLARSLAAAKGD